MNTTPNREYNVKWERLILAPIVSSRGGDGERGYFLSGFRPFQMDFRKPMTPFTE
jgi:hypothetical protein